MERPMGVLFLINSLQIGGSEAKTVRIVNALYDRGFPVYLGYLNFSQALKNSVHPDVPVINFQRQGKFDPSVIRNIGKFIQKHKIQKIFCINLYPSLYGVITRASLRGVKLDCISCVNTSDFTGFKKTLSMLFYTHVLRRADKIIFGCEKQKKQWISRYRLRPSNCTHIYNGVDLSKFTRDTVGDAGTGIRNRIGLSPKETVIISVAQLRPEKRHVDLITACSILARGGYDVRLLLVGDGPERQRLETHAESTLPGRVIFMGQTEDVRPALSAADIFALPSVAVETFSNAALEAMAMGVPVVLSDIGGAAEMVQDGVSGYLYPPGDMPALAHKLSLLVKDSQERKRIAQQATRTVYRKFSFESMLREYEKLISQGSGPNSCSFKGHDPISPPALCKQVSSREKDSPWKSKRTVER